MPRELFADTMPTFRLNPVIGAPCLRHAGSLSKATSRGLREFPAGLLSVELLGLAELATLARAGAVLPVAARRSLDARDKAAAAAAQTKRTAERKRDAARARLNRKKEAEAEKRSQLREQDRKERFVLKRRDQRRQARSAARTAVLATVSMGLHPESHS